MKQIESNVCQLFFLKHLLGRFHIWLWLIFLPPQIQFSHLKNLSNLKANALLEPNQNDYSHHLEIWKFNHENDFHMLLLLFHINFWHLCIQNFPLLLTETHFLHISKVQFWKMSNFRQKLFRHLGFHHQPEIEFWLLILGQICIIRFHLPFLKHNYLQYQTQI